MKNVVTGLVAKMEFFCGHGFGCFRSEERSLICKHAEKVGFAHDEQLFMVKLDLGADVFPK